MDLSLGTRREITKKYATDYAKSSKNAKGLILDELIAVTGWSSANARRSLSTARKRKGLAKAVVRKPRARTYGYDTLKVLISVWRIAGMPSGKYLAATMDLWLPKLQTFGELDTKRLTPAAGAQLLQVSAPRSTVSLSPPRTRPDPTGSLRPGQGRCCGTPSRSARPGTNTNRHPASSKPTWSSTAAPPWPGIRQNPDRHRRVHRLDRERRGPQRRAHKWVLEAMDEVVARLPCAMVGLDTDYADPRVMPTFRHHASPAP
jgi:hypothetical protein